MDIHRCRFVPYPPSAINALAFSHTSSLTSTSTDFPCLRLAIGRANGDIEIWNPLQGVWHQESVIHGGKGRSIEGLVWTQDPDDFDKNEVQIPGRLRLFSIGYSTAVTEWDLALGKALRHSSGNYGEVWCIAAQPKPRQDGETRLIGQTSGDGESDLHAQNIVAGCADGAIVLLSTADGDLRFLRTLARPSKRKARVLSITFQNRDIVLAGHADSTIRVFDIRSGRQIQNMTLGAGPRGGPKEILVWSVRCLPNGGIVSGDSTGTVMFWDGKHYSLVQRIQGHVADILDLVVSADGETVISGGMDRRTTVYRRMGTGNTGERRRWAEITHRRIHKHDVKAMATFEMQNFSVLASGGLDTTPIITPIREFGRENHLSLSNLPQLPPVGGAPVERLMMSWWGSEIRIWRFASRQTDIDAMGEGDQFDVIHPKTLVARVLVQGDEALTSAEMTLDGSVLVACTITGVKIFRLRRKADDGLKVSKMEVPQSVAGTGAKIAKFSPDGKWLLLVRSSGEVEMYRVVKTESSRTGLSFRPKAVHLKRLSREPTKRKIQCGSLGRYERSVSRVAFSANSKIITTGDLCGYLDSWVLEGHEDLTQEDDQADNASISSASSDDETADEADQSGVILGQRWIRNPAASLLPQLPAAPLILSFRPSRSHSDSHMPNGNMIPHPTRQPPHPHSLHVAPGEDRLFALTSDHQMYEFNILSGKLSNWSRRNPTASLPLKFRKIIERVKGSVWDTNQAKERIWVYGSSWLWMFDLSKDFPMEAEAGNVTTSEDAAVEVNGTKSSQRKRRRIDTNVEEEVRQSTGAGGRALDSELSIGIGRKFWKAKGPDLTQSHWVSTDGEQTLSLDRDDNHAVNESALIRLRRDSGQRSQTAGNITGVVKIDGCESKEINDELRIDESNSYNGLPYWGTHKYRDILGIVPLGSRNREGENGDDELPGGVEVALVERPIWDVELPPKYYGNQEWDK